MAAAVAVARSSTSSAASAGAGHHRVSGSCSDLPPHTQLIDGSLVFVSPQRLFHSTVIDLLV
ncbi:hypothetical protein ABZ450_36085, partial [Streptomyces microflavus]